MHVAAFLLHFFSINVAAVAGARWREEDSFVGDFRER